MTAWDEASVTGALVAAGCVAASDEAVELVHSASDGDELDRMVQRRLTGEPLAWITGSARFCGLDIQIRPGVYVPRWQSEPLAILAAELLPATGVGVDLCTGSGAIGAVMRSARPRATVVGTEVDPVASACAGDNGVVVYEGHLDEALPARLLLGVDVMVGVLPYVPTDALGYLPRDVLAFEPMVALDGGPGGLALVSTAIDRSRRWVRSGGWLLLEVGGDQVSEVSVLLDAAGYRDVGVLEDEEGDPRGIVGRRSAEST